MELPYVHLHNHTEYSILDGCLKVADLADGSAQSFWGTSGIGGHAPGESVRVFCGDRVVGVDSPELPM